MNNFSLKITSILAIAWFSAQGVEVKNVAIAHLLQTPYCIAPVAMEVSKQQSSQETNSGFFGIEQGVFAKVLANIRYASKIEELHLESDAMENTFASLTRILGRYYSNENTIINAKLLRDLDILKKRSEDADLMSELWKLLEIQTVVGKIESYLILSDPTADGRLLKERQALIQQLCALPELLADITDISKNMANLEASSLKLIMQDPLNENERKLIFPALIPQTWSRLLQLFLATKTIIPMVSLPLSMTGFAASAVVTKKQNLDARIARIQEYQRNPNRNYSMQQESFIEYKGGWKEAFKQTFADAVSVKDLVKEAWKQSSAGVKIGITAYGTFFAAMQLFLIANSYVLYQFYAQRSVRLQKKIMDIKQYLNHCDHILESLQQQNTLNAPEIGAFKASMQAPAIQKLRSLLENDTFSSEPSTWSNWARIFLAAQEIYAARDLIADIMHGVGRLELFSRLARLMVSDEQDVHQKSAFCFPEYVLEGDNPVCEMNNGWNPLILTHKNRESVVANNLSLGADCKNVILTGPNTCGKTMITTGFIIALLMGQSFGIVPAAECRMTPFHKILVTLTVSSDGTVGDSRFKSELREAKQLLTTVKETAARNEFTIALLDEIFTGTNPQDGEIAAYEFLKQLGHCDRSIIILATHFFKLTELETAYPRLFINYKVVADRLSDGTISRAFKIVPGISKLNIAMDLLKQEGLLL